MNVSPLNYVSYHLDEWLKEPFQSSRKKAWRPRNYEPISGYSQQLYEQHYKKETQRDDQQPWESFPSAKKEDQMRIGSMVLVY